MNPPSFHPRFGTRPPRAGRDPTAWEVASLPTGLELAAAESYCRQVAGRHYENFSVVSGLVPRRLRQDFATVYTFCRWSDDLADECPDPVAGLAALAEWRCGLDDCFAGRPGHPVFVALAETARRGGLDARPFHDLLDAFAEDLAFDRDGVVVRYRDRRALVEYCRRSADPVGRIVLGLDGCHGAAEHRDSDAICTGLQLVNFWQDLQRDRRAGRVYVPESDLRDHRVTADDLAAPRATPAVRALVASLVGWARECFTAGAALETTAPPALRPAIGLFRSGGLALVSAIERTGHDTLAARPTVAPLTKARLLSRALLAASWARVRGSAAGLRP